MRTPRLGDTGEASERAQAAGRQPCCIAALGLRRGAPQGSEEWPPVLRYSGAAGVGRAVGGSLSLQSDQAGRMRGSAS